MELATLQAALGTSYVLEREIGRGGMATVWLARDIRHNRSVALKVLDAEVGVTIGPERFAREIELAAQLQHPNILAVFDSGNAAGSLWYTMPYVDGESLGARIKRERQLPLDDALQITRGVAEALDYAHAKGVVHRDVKPENVLIYQGHAMLADFGIARAAANTQLTGTGLAIGTPQYMSPEQASGEHNLDGRSDLYALGCVLYEMLAGEPPFTGPSAQAVVSKHLGAPIPSVRILRPDVPAHVDAAIGRALAKSPASRFATTGEFMAALARPAARPPVSRKAAIRAAIALVAVVAVTATVWAATQSSLFGDKRPVVILMDSSHPARIYDSSTMASNGTNADVLSDVLADLPITTQKEAIGPAWHREDEIRRFDPDLIAIHYSGFCQEECVDRTRLRQLVEVFAKSDTRFIIYSRQSGDSLRIRVDSLLRDVETAHPGTLRRVSVFGLRDHGSLRWRDPAVAGAFKLRVKELLDIE
ncbi:MAG: serine/threonine-protein kinase [Gemmatimonadaceae bacterium]